MQAKTSQREMQKVPKLRFAGFEGGWEEKRIENLVAVFKSGESITSGSITEVGDYPVYGGNGLRGYSNEFTHDGAYFLIGRQGALCGNITKVNGKVFISEHAIAVKANTSSDTDWLATRLTFLNLNKLSESSAQPGLSVAKLKRLKLIVPSKSEQQKIAGFLGGVDEWIENLRAQKESFESYKKGITQKIFSQEIRFKDDKGNEFPWWEEKKLGDCLNYEQPTNYIVESTEYKDEYKTPVLTAGKTFILGYTDETKGIFDVSRLPVIIFDDFTTTQQFVDFQFKVKSSAMKILSAKNDTDIKFIYEAMQLIRYEIGGHGRHWISKYSNIKISAPSLLEQQKIAEFLTSVDKVLESKQQQITLAEQWKRGLMQGLFV